MINKDRFGISIVIISLLVQAAIVMAFIGVPYWVCVVYAAWMSYIVLDWMKRVDLK